MSRPQAGACSPGYRASATGGLYRREPPEADRLGMHPGAGMRCLGARLLS
jgi:hypothetical protein